MISQKILIASFLVAAVAICLVAGQATDYTSQLPSLPSGTSSSSSSAQDFIKQTFQDPNCPFRRALAQMRAEFEKFNKQGQDQLKAIQARIETLRQQGIPRQGSFSASAQ